MPEEETNNSNCQCEVCSCELEEDAVIESTHQYEIVCSDCESSMVSCDGCNELFTNDDAPYSTCSGHPVCEPCSNSGNFQSCVACHELINTDHGDYYYDSNYDEYCCSDQAGDQELSWSCSRCDCTMYFTDAGTDYAESELCYDCYHNPESSLADDVYRFIDHDAVSGNYQALSSSAKSQLNWFYSYNNDNYEHSNLQILKGGLELNSFGYAESSIKVASPVYKEFAYIIKEMIGSELFFTRHKKYGLYHPLRHLFHSCIKYYDRQNGDSYNYRGGTAIDFESVVTDLNRYSVEGSYGDKIAQMLRTNKTDDGGNLQRAVTNVFNRSLKERFDYFNLRRMDDQLAAKRYNQYLTNAVDVEYPLQIGFDPTDLKDVAEFNASVGSCQDQSNRGSYSFGFADLLVNPHLFALIRDDNNEIIGRSVIRFFKHNWDDDSEPVSVAPSRLYLKRNTQAKKEFYVQLFKQIDAWAYTAFDSHQMIAYSSSRHDSSVYSYIRDSFDFVNHSTNKSMQTQRWFAFWHTKPRDSSADYSYYQDEGQHTRVVGIRNGGLGDYAMQETMSDYDYKIIGANNEN